jgi:hypothetical protein
MTWKSKLILGILTAVAMFCLSFLLPRGGSLREAQAAQFPMTVGVWAIFVLLFVKLKQGSPMMIGSVHLAIRAERSMCHSLGPEKTELPMSRRSGAQSCCSSGRRTN